MQHMLQEPFETPFQEPPPHGLGHDSATVSPVDSCKHSAGDKMTHDKRLWSYEQVHEIVRKAVMEESYFDDWRPTLIICIAAGGFVPTRILRSFMKAKYSCNIPVQTIGLQLYDLQDRDPATSPVERTQWLSYGTGPGQVQLQGHKILLVDEVDDSRKTLAHAMSELEQDIAAERFQHKQSNHGQPWQAPELGVFVLHNKLRTKLAELPDHIMSTRYWAFDIDNCWCVYPWDALHIYDHTQTAEAAGLTGCRPHKHERRQSSGCPAAALQQQQLGCQGDLTAAAAAEGSLGAASNGHTAANGCTVAASIGSVCNGVPVDGSSM